MLTSNLRRYFHFGPNFQLFNVKKLRIIISNISPKWKYLLKLSPPLKVWEFCLMKNNFSVTKKYLVGIDVFKNMIGLFLLSFKKISFFFLGQICGCSEARLSCVASHFSQHVALLHDHPKVPPLHNGAKVILEIASTL